MATKFKTQHGNENFVMDVKEIRANARKNLDKGAITETYAADLQTVLKLLNDSLATELVCVLRYKRHHYMASGIHAESVAEEFAIHAEQEMQHADSIATRIVELGGEPDFAPDTLTARSHAEYVPAKDLHDMIKENLVAERIAIDSYRKIITYIGDGDPTTRRLLEEILAVEEEHANDMADLLERG